MIRITRIDLDNLDVINSGNFGVVYRDNNLAYKIYKDECKTSYGYHYPNPMKKKRIRRINRMMELDSRLKYTDLCRDIVYVNGDFGGICIPCYDGETLNNLMNSDFKLKMDISRQLVRNAKELTNNCIYPMDYKLNNIMLVDGDVKILDLDDVFTRYTRIPIPLLKRKSIRELDDTIKCFFGEHDRYRAYYGKDVERPRYNIKSSYEGIEDYLKEKSKSRKLIIINYSLLNDEVIRYLCGLDGYDVIVTYNGTKYDDFVANKYIDDFNKFDRNIFDVVGTKELEEYLSNFNLEEVLEYKGQLVKVR